MITSTTERYLRLGLQLGRHDDGVVDAYFGPPELAAEVEAAPPVEPPALVAAAQALLDDLDDGWLRDQVIGLRTCAGVLAGETRPYADEVEGYYGVRPTHTDEAVFAEAHERLAELLPGDGPLGQRHRDWESAMVVPAEAVESTMAAVIEQARAQTGDLVELPDGEGVAVETIEDVSWLGYNFYLGDLRGRVVVNVGRPMSALELLILALHEAYPGHQAERASKEHLLVRGRGMVEETIVLAPTPQSLITEGLAVIAPGILLDGAGGPALAAVIHDAGVGFDLAESIAIRRATEPLRWVEVNAALMLHEAGAGEVETREYLQRWGLLTPELAAHVVRFVTEPSSRTYVINYAAGMDLCGRFVAGDRDRFRRLLTEQIRVRDLATATA